MIFPFTEKINHPNISEAFITLVALNIEQFYHSPKQIINLGCDSTYLQFVSIYYEFR